MIAKLPSVSCLVIILLFSFGCKKEDAPDKYTFIKVHHDWSIDSYGPPTSSTTTSGIITIYLPPIEQNAMVIFEEDTLSPYKHEQSDTSYWFFTPHGDYNYSPYSGSYLQYFPSNDSIHYSNWYGGSHTASHSDNYYGKKIN